MRYGTERHACAARGNAPALAWSCCIQGNMAGSASHRLLPGTLSRLDPDDPARQRPCTNWAGPSIKQSATRIADYDATAGARRAQTEAGSGK